MTVLQFMIVFLCIQYPVAIFSTVLDSVNEYENVFFTKKIMLILAFIPFMIIIPAFNGVYLAIKRSINKMK